MSKPNGLFDLNIFEGADPNDVKNLPINEESEFAPQSYAQTGADNGVKDGNVSVPGGTGEKPTAKPEGGEHGPSAPGGDGSGKGQNYGPSIPKGTELSTDEWNHAMTALKHSFKEGYELLEMLESCKIVEKTTEQRQAEFLEAAMGDAILLAYEDGPVFEAVDVSDKNEVKRLVRKLRPKIEEACNDMDVHFYKPNLVARTIVGAWPPTSALTGASAFQQIWTTRLWQVVGICHAEAGNIKEITNQLTEKFKDDLDEYKVLAVAAIPAITDLFKLKFGWKNTKGCYFLLIDKKVPKIIKDAMNEIGSNLKKGDAKGDGKDDGEKDDKKGGKGKKDKPIKESGEEPEECKDCKEKDCDGCPHNKDD